MVARHRLGIALAWLASTSAHARPADAPSPDGEPVVEPQGPPDAAAEPPAHDSADATADPDAAVVPDAPLPALPPAAPEIRIGEQFRLGLGVAIGFPPSATVRYAVDPRRAVAVHLGPTMVTTGLHLRVQYEQRIADLRAWSFGQLSLTWQIGAVVALIFGQDTQGRPVRPGITTGIGVELAFGVAPAAVFAEIAPVVYPLDLVPSLRTAFLPAGLTVVVGGRWYLDVGRRAARPVADDALRRISR